MITLAGTRVGDSDGVIWISLPSPRELSRGFWSFETGISDSGPA